MLVASYNMRKAIGTDRQRRPERILAVLREIGADIVALQECDRRFGTRASAIPPELLAEHSGWAAVPFGIRQLSMGWHGNAILIPRDAEVLRAEALDLPMIEPRGAVLADIALAAGRIRVVGMHLDLSGLYRRRQARAILAHLETLPPMATVLMGDLNEWSRERGCLKEFGATLQRLEPGPSFHARQPLARLDRIFASRDLHVEGCGVHHSALARLASDHLPVWARLSFR